MSKNTKYYVYLNEIPTLNNYSFVEYTKIKKLKKSDDIFLFDILDFLNDDDGRLKFLSEIAKKLKKDGVIQIQGIDAILLSSAVLHKQIDLLTYNNLVFNGRKILHTTSSIFKLLQENGFVVLDHKIINGIQYYVRAGSINNE